MAAVNGRVPAQFYQPESMQKLRIDAPPAFTGKEDFEYFFKRLRNWLSLTDTNYGGILRSIQTHFKNHIVDDAFFDFDGRALCDG